MMSPRLTLGMRSASLGLGKISCAVLRHASCWCLEIQDFFRVPWMIFGELSFGVFRLKFFMNRPLKVSLFTPYFIAPKTLKSGEIGLATMTERA